MTVVPAQAPTHSDVQAKVGGQVWAKLTHASPFLSCSVQATPGAPARDLSSSVTAALTAFAGLGAPAVALATAEEVPAQKRAISKEDLQKMLKEDLEQWKYTFPGADEAEKTVRTLSTQLNALLQDESKLEQPLRGQSDAVAAADLADLRKIRDSIGQYLGVINSIIAKLSDAEKAENNEKTGRIEKAPKLDLTVIALPMDSFRQKTVSETITCKDAATQMQPFPTMTFTAYYENTPRFDISAGMIASLTPGRQVGAVPSAISASGPAPIMAGTQGCVPSSAPANCLEETSHSNEQFMPATFFEFHIANWRWPWAIPGNAYHPFGYVGSIGPAFGIAINPNNGTAEGEFFEGVSIGIQRVAIMIGAHNGRYQTFTDGYYVGEELPMAISPRTERAWTTHLAFGISYRIALH